MLTKKSLELLATEIFKSKTGVFPKLMNYIFHFVERLYKENEIILFMKVIRKSSFPLSQSV